MARRCGSTATVSAGRRRRKPSTNALPSASRKRWRRSPPACPNPAPPSASTSCGSASAGSRKTSRGVGQHYEIELIPDAKGEKAVELRYRRKPVNGGSMSHPGVYCLRSSETDWDEETLWRTYITLTDLEAVFRSLKSELGLRPVYHTRKRGPTVTCSSPCWPISSCRSFAASWPTRAFTQLAHPAPAALGASPGHGGLSTARRTDPACTQGHPSRGTAPGDLPCAGHRTATRRCAQVHPLSPVFTK